MEAVLFKIIIHVQEMVDHGHAPIGDDGQDEGKNVIGDRRQEWFSRGEGVARQRRQVIRDRGVGSHDGRCRTDGVVGHWTKSVFDLKPIERVSK